MDGLPEGVMTQGKDNPLPSIYLKLTGVGMCVLIVVPAHVLDMCAMR